MKHAILLALLLAIAATSGTARAGVRLDLDADITVGLGNSTDAAEISLQGQTGSGISVVFLGGIDEEVQTPPLTAFLSSSHNSVATMETVVFDASASLPGDGFITLYEWDLDGDGQFDQSSTLATWEHSYTENGAILIQVRITNNLGETSLSAALPVEIVNRPPTARFEVEPSVAMEGNPIQFLDHADDEDGTISSWLWYFGDGTSSHEANPTHIYSAAGYYNVMLFVTDDDGGGSETYLAGIEIRNLKPRAAFSLRQSPAAAGQPVTLVDESFDPSLKGEIVHVAWDFGDGSYQAGGPSSANLYTHVFSAPGSYTITLYVIDNDGAIALAQTTVDVP